MTGRLRSLDVFRGLTVAAMILVNNPGSWSYVYPPLAHAEWNGWTPTDLIFPLFLFIVGVSLVVAFTRREAAGATGRSLARKALVRGALIVLIGLLLNGFPRYQLDTIRIPGVLQRIGVVYALTAFIFLGFGPVMRRRIAGLLLVGYWVLMTFVPVPGGVAGDLSQAGNLGAWLDRLLLGGHLWTPVFDPEGILSTLPAIATCLLGTFAGERLLADATPGDRATGLFLSGAALLVAGLAWNAWFPINKSLWTSSYVLFSGGIAFQALAACYWIVDVRHRGAWARPFEVFGTNALFAFVLSGLLGRLLELWTVAGPDGQPIGGQEWLFDQVLRPLAGPRNGSLLFALASVGLMFVLTGVLYRRRWFLRL
jgi:predicted acyltransferase